MNVPSRPRQIFRPDPVVGWTLTPERQIRVPFRDGVIQTIGADGWRHVPGTPADPRGNLVLYGCSFVYGTGLEDEETLAARLQSGLGRVRVVNKGVGGQGSVQAFLKFRADIRANRVQAAVFGVISDHRYRNVPHPNRMRAFLSPDWHQIGVEHVPCARFDRRGAMSVDYVPIWQPGLHREDFQAFLPDEHLLDHATLGVLHTIAALAAEHNIPILFALLDQLDPGFNARVLADIPHALDISTPYDRAHTFMPRDIHPNAAANRLFAERLLPELGALMAEV